MDSPRDILNQGLMRLTLKFWVSSPLSITGVVLVSLLLTLRIFNAFLWYISCWFFEHADGYWDHLWKKRRLISWMSSKVPIKRINNFLVILHLTSVEETHNIFLVLSSVTLEMKVHVIFRSANSYKKQWM